MSKYLRTRLSIQMFLTFAVIGAWQPVLAEHLKSIGLGDVHIGLIMGTAGLACILSPLVAGQAVDRWFATERLLAAGNLVCGILLLAAYGCRDFLMLWGLLFGASLFFVVSIPLGTSLALHHLSDGARQFPGVRTWGTVGWIAGAWMLWARLRFQPGSNVGDGLAIAAVLALLNAAYSLSLPHTPPRKDAPATFAVRPAIGMLRDPSFALFTGAMFVVTLFAAFYFSRVALYLPLVGVDRQDLSGILSLGQWVEIPFVVALGFVYSRLGVKTTLALGIAAWILRFACFSVGPSLGLAIVAVALHGPCFAFGRIAATLYVDRVCPRDIRATAQSFLSVVMDGAGMFLGSMVAGWVGQRSGSDWSTYWLIPCAGCLIVLACFLAGFRGPTVPVGIAAARPSVEVD